MVTKMHLGLAGKRFPSLTITSKTRLLPCSTPVLRLVSSTLADTPVANWCCAGFVPQYYFDAMYKHIDGIKAISKSEGLYEIPCDTKFNVSMIFK